MADAEGLRASCLAMLEFDAQAHLMPDPIGLKDLRSANFNLIGRSLDNRCRSGCFPRSRHIERYPKGFDASQYRVLSEFDVLDQIGLRQLAVPVIPLLENQLTPKVAAHRYLHSGGRCGWRQRSLSEGAKQRRRHLESSLLADASSYMAVLDVKDFFPSVGAPLALRSLASIGLDDSCLDGLRRLFVELSGLPGRVDGLPVGPEFSGVLGTAALVPLDRTLSRYQFSRFVDDVWVTVPTLADGELVIDLVRDQLRAMGLTLNEAKSRVVSSVEALEMLSDPLLAYMSSRGDRVREDDAIDLFELAIVESKLNHYRFALAAFGRLGSLHGLNQALVRPELFDVDPRAFGKYLRGAAKRVDIPSATLLTDHVVASSDDHSLSGRSVLAKSLGDMAISKDDASRLVAFAGSSCDRKAARVRANALAAACRHADRHGVLDQCVQVAEAVDDLDMARIVGYQLGQDLARRSSRTALRHLRRVRPEVEGFVSASIAKC